MKHIRFLSLLLALVTVLSLFAACKKDEPEPDPQQGQSEEPEVVELRLVANGSARYVIVHDYKAGHDVIAACQKIQETIRDLIGANIEIRQCFSDRTDVAEDVETDREILVGMTNREESREALGSLRSHDYVLGVYGKKLVIGSSSDTGTNTAVTQFVTQYIYKQGSRAGVADGKKYTLVFSSEDNTTVKGTYSYSVSDVLGARIDSFYLIYPTTKEDKSGAAKELAADLQSYISAETGYELITHPDTYSADYEVLIGNTRRSDEARLQSLADNEYYISLTAKKNEAGEIVGGTWQILYGREAQHAALNAFKRQVLPASKEVIELHLTDGLVWTNQK